MKTLWMVLLSLCMVPISAQFQITMHDSAWKTLDQFKVDASFRRKDGFMKRFGTGDNDISFKRIKWKSPQCGKPEYNTFYFNRAGVIQSGGTIEIYARYKRKYLDTLRFRIPLPVSLRFPDSVTSVRVNDNVGIPGSMIFDDGSSRTLANNVDLFKLISIDVLVGIALQGTQIRIPSDVYIPESEIRVCILNQPSSCSAFKVRGNYGYDLYINANGRDGGNGLSGNNGKDGCADCNDRGYDGTAGDAGYDGGRGGDGLDTEIWLKQRDSSVILVKVLNARSQNVISYIDLAHGGRILAALNGGNGGNGGEGGRGGDGLDEIAGKGPGYGGNGGRGGNGGNGGNGGDLILYVDSASAGWSSKITFYNSGGTGGLTGESGKGGRGGRKEKAGILGTLITGRRGEDGVSGNPGASGVSGSGLKIRNIKYE
jgi:hypothetical protein